MTGFFRHISRFILAALCASGLVACRADHPDGTASRDRHLLVLHIRPVDTRAAAEPESVTERIKSLRIIVLGKDDAGNYTSVEYNKAIRPGDFVASSFSYEVTLPTTAGKKDIYLIANEESVTSLLQYEPEEGTTLPAEQSVSFPELMKQFGIEEDGTENGSLFPNTAPQPDPGAFASLLRSVHFAPAYTADENDAVYLPYASSYHDLEAKKEQVNEMTLYLVPVATKFEFNFINYRPHDVEVQGISVSSVHSDNFLLARVGGDDVTKEFDTASLYWVDWLAKVSEASQLYPGSSSNSNFNSRYGWIFDYTIPSDNNADIAIFVSTDPSDTKADIKEVCEIPKGSKNGEEEIASRLTVGPFYRPESRHEVTVRDENGKDVETVATEQRYTLTLHLHDKTQKEEDDPIFEDVVIENLRALFRSTRVVINVTLRQGNVEVYAEIAPWNKKKANGWVIEGEEPRP